MIIALKNLNQHNELSMIESEDTLTCERNIVLFEDENMRFNAKEEELTFFIVLKL